MFKKKSMNASVLKSMATVFAVSAMSLMTGCGGQQQQMPQAGAPAFATMVLSTSNSELESTYPALIKGKTDIAIRPRLQDSSQKYMLTRDSRCVRDRPCSLSTRFSFRQQ